MTLAAVVEVLRDAGIFAPQPRALLAAADTHTPRLQHIQDAHAVRARARPRCVFAEERRARLSRKHDCGRLLRAGTPTFSRGSVGCRHVCLQSRARELAATRLTRAGAQRRRAHRDGAARRVSTRPRSRHRVSSGMDGPSRQRRHGTSQSSCSMSSPRSVATTLKFRAASRALADWAHETRRAGAPWRAADALDVITTLDMPAWAALVGLLNECPVLHAGIRATRGSGTHAVSATDFELISENSQIASIREFLRSLSETLRP